MAFVLAFAGAMTCVGFLLVALVSEQARHAALVSEQMSLAPANTSAVLSPASESPQPSSAAAEEPEGTTPPSQRVDAPLPLPPPITRDVPVFPGRFLEGCSAGDLETIERVLSAAIGKGAPLYNDGDIPGCVDAYERGATELESALPPTCSGPLRALAHGRIAASRQNFANGRAWAFRDAFDGLIEVLDRSRTGGVISL